ncbi:A disintegrin and metalloproteinase with thrombospondin motifs 17 isoform X1 [Lates japonicus]|uniref:A disintegrin and metalloproteinase with thrombospondin motifs 17 isoform X1 n=1 Tax=Lates japonicus TaxID=270547 RepID=A0AAD3NG80_LATJO|nr:A disintegrin and metalloproteinase with thrombospondin motifs 17 isoform X1 [Lates japonicus]
MICGKNILDSWITGLVQIGEDSLFIQPVGENDPSQSFSGLKHRLLRHRRSAKTSSAPDADQPSYCGTIQAAAMVAGVFFAHHGGWPGSVRGSRPNTMLKLTDEH